MSQPAERHNHRFFANIYDRTSRSRGFRQLMDPSRRQLAQMAHGVVLEVGAGGGQNFSFYDPAITARVEAVEPNAYMLRRAEVAAGTARVPIHLMAAPVEHLPFTDASFDAALATLVFCSVDDPAQGLREIARVLKPGGALLLLEHVRSPQRGWARVQTWATPIQRRIAGNCHLDRPTGDLVRSLGFTITTEQWQGGGIHPLLTLVAQRA